MKVHRQETSPKDVKSTQQKRKLERIPPANYPEDRLDIMARSEGTRR